MLCLRCSFVEMRPPYAPQGEECTYQPLLRTMVHMETPPSRQLTAMNVTATLPTLVAGTHAPEQLILQLVGKRCAHVMPSC